jgi:hypothetical protein
MDRHAEGAYRDADETPRMEQRGFTDERGRSWVGSVTSGTWEGGEENAEAIFVCTDQPSEPKRVARLRVPAREVDDYWRGLDESEVRNVFESSEEAR